MPTWSYKRKLIYALIAIGIVVLIIGVPLFLLFYESPTCFDLKKNGDEFGIDCGGSCVRLCQSDFLPPRISWGGAKIEKVADGFYNVASYIVNQNISGGAIDVPYKVTLYDAQGLIIVEKSGEVTLYPRRNSLAFLPSVNTGKRVPIKASFEFTSAPEWFKSSDTLEGINITDKKYIENENGSSLEITLENNTLTSYRNLLVSVVLYDVNGNSIGFSQTKIDSIPAKSIGGNSVSAVAPYTWPTNRNGKVTSIEVIIITVPISAY